MQNNNIKFFNGVIESVRGVVENGETWIEVKLEYHKPYFRISQENYAEIRNLFFIGHETIIKAYRGHRHWMLIGIDSSLDFFISKLGGPTDHQARRWLQKQICS